VSFVVGRQSSLGHLQIVHEAVLFIERVDVSRTVAM
jgi:hypothetical protein